MRQYAPVIAIVLILTGIILFINSTLNYAIFNAINHALPLETFWLIITNSGDVLFIGCLLFILLRHDLRLLMNLLICAVFAHYLVKYGKLFFAELRPEHAPNLPMLISYGSPIDANNYAMPSGHTATAFIAALFITKAHRIQGWKLWMIFMYAALIGISRIAVGAHWPSDVFVGTGIGILIALLFTNATLNIQHKFAAWLTYILYLPFMLLAIGRIRFIDSPSTMMTEGIFVIVGLLAVVAWSRKLKQEFLMR